MKKITILLLTFIAATIAIICLCCCKTNKASAVYNIKFYIDGKQHSTISVKYGSPLEFPDIKNTDDDGNVFIGWFTSSDYDEWFTEETVTKNFSVYGYWSSVEDSLLNITFYDNGNKIKEYQIQKGNYIENLSLPETDDGYSLDSWLLDGKPYDFNVRPLTSLELHASRKATEYTVEFISLGEVISTQTYTVENYNIVEPACPKREHYYEGKWDEYELTKGNIQINAIYEPINYTVEYIDGSGTTLGKFDYNILNYKEIIPPEPTNVPGCRSYWDKLECGMTTIHLKVEILEYNIEYFVNDKLIASFKTNIFDINKLEVPEIPQIAGYTSYWENFKLHLETNIKVHAKYELITYYVSFIADNNIIDKIEYNVENTDIKIPEFPTKAGYTGNWEDFKLETGDVTVSAKYKPIDYTASFIVIDELIETETKLTYTTTFNAENMNIIFPEAGDYPFVAGCGINWTTPTLGYHDILIKGYYYDTDYTYIDFVQVKETDELDNVINHYFYVSGLSSDGYKNKTSNIVIPEKYHNLPVTYIDNDAFLKNKFIRTVEIYGVERIKDSAFSCCNSLQSVILHDGIKYIEPRVFYGSSYLLKINIPETVSQLGEYAFSNIGITSINIPATIDKIPECLFYECVDLKEIVIPESVTEISYGAFYGCSSLTNLTIGSNVKIIKDSAFAYCYSLKVVNIPANVNLIESNAFAKCSNLKSFNILDCNSNWYLLKDNDYSQKILIPKNMLIDGKDLADNLRLIPNWGLYREID